MAEAIVVQQVSKTFGRIQALESVTFGVPERSIFGLLGPNGAGKTTLLSIIAGFLRANRGTAEILGIDCRQVAQLQGRLSVFPQDARFQGNVPILDQLVFFQLLNGRSRTEAHEDVRKSLDMVGLGSMAKRRVGTLSHGMVKRLGIAQAFLGEPEVILLDEPTAGLDPANARQTRDLIGELQAQATVVISSHNLAEIQELCDHVGILHHGKLVRCGPVEEITRSGREFHLTLARPLESTEMSHLCSLEGVRRIADYHADDAQPPERASYVVVLDLSHRSHDEIVSAVLTYVLGMGITPRGFSEGRSLETHFLEITGDGNDE